jgi:hypothetical protein
MNATGASSIPASPHKSWIDALKTDVSRQKAVWITALLVAIVHAATAGRYDAQRNELYFLVCGWHPDFGYVDQPPLVPLIAAATSGVRHQHLDAAPAGDHRSHCIGAPRGFLRKITWAAGRGRRYSPRSPLASRPASPASPRI